MGISINMVPNMETLRISQTSEVMRIYNGDKSHQVTNVMGYIYITKNIAKQQALFNRYFLYIWDIYIYI